MNLVDELDVAVVEFGRGDVVGGVVVVGTNVDDRDISSWVCIEVPVRDVYRKSERTRSGNCKVCSKGA